MWNRLACKLWTVGRIPQRTKDFKGKNRVCNTLYYPNTLEAKVGAA